jgi:hypothetical protein
MRNASTSSYNKSRGGMLRASVCVVPRAELVAVHALEELRQRVEVLIYWTTTRPSGG